MRIADGKIVVLVIEVQGAENIRKMYPQSHSVFIMPPSVEVLENRLRNRKTETEEKIQSRIRQMDEILDDKGRGRASGRGCLHIFRNGTRGLLETLQGTSGCDHAGRKTESGQYHLREDVDRKTGQFVWGFVLRL